MMPSVSRVRYQHTLAVGKMECACLHVLYIDLSHCLMMLCGMMFGEVVCKVSGTWSPKYDELSLVYTVSNPVKTHVYCFCLLDFDIVVGNPCGSGVVSDDWSGLLFMAKLFKGITFRDGFLTVDKEAS